MCSKRWWLVLVGSSFAARVVERAGQDGEVRVVAKIVRRRPLSLAARGGAARDAAALETWQGTQYTWDNIYQRRQQQHKRISGPRLYGLLSELPDECPLSEWAPAR